MTVADLSFSRKKLLARKIRELLEPDGVKSEKITKQIELRRLILSEENIVIDGMADVIKILNSNYSQKTITRLLSKIQKSVVWDTSICHLPIQKLNTLFYQAEKNNIISSLTFNELFSLSQNKDASPEDRQHAKFLYMSILEDTDSKYCTTVNITKTTYVDTQLIEYCVENNYSLYTHDLLMGLRAKCNHIDVTIFNVINEAEIPKYNPNPNGKNIIIDIDTLRSVDIKDVVCIAQEMNAGKFIFTYEFIEAIEKHKGSKYVKTVSAFLGYDSNNKYSIYLNKEESAFSFEELAKKYNATIFTNDTDKCFDYKTRCVDFKLVSSVEDRQFMEKLSNSLNSLEIPATNVVINCSNNASSDTSNDTSNNASNQASVKKQVYCIPHCFPQNKALYVHNLPINEKLWVLNNENVEISLKDQRKIKLDSGYTIIHGINTLKDGYTLTAYRVVKQAGTYIGLIVFSTEFYKGSVDCVDPKYKHYAKSLSLLT